MEVIVLGSGCKKCKTTYELIEKVLLEKGITADLKKEEDIMEIMKYNILSTPAVVVNGEVKIKGRVPSESEIIKLLEE